MPNPQKRDPNRTPTPTLVAVAVLFLVAAAVKAVSHDWWIGAGFAAAAASCTAAAVLSLRRTGQR